MPPRPPSRAATSAVAPSVQPPKAIDFVEQPVQNALPVAPAKARTPSPPPARVEMDEMEVEVEVPLNDTTEVSIKPISLGSTTVPLFPIASTLSLSRKPSFAALPNPSPMRKSVRGDTTTPHARSRSSAATGPSGHRTSGWLKGTATTPASATADKKLSAKKAKDGLEQDEKTAANTAANAALTAASIAPVVQAAPATNSKPPSNNLKRKSEVASGAESGEERASKASKKDGKTFAMERDDDDEEDTDAGPHEDDTAERLLKLRGMLKIGSVSDMGLAEKPPRVESRPTADLGEFRPVSRAGDESNKGKNTKESKIGKPAIVSPLKVSELVGAWEKKREASPSADRQAGFGLPKFAPLAKMANVGSTTPPDSPAVTKVLKATTVGKTLERVPSTLSNASVPTSIFKAPPKTNIFTAPAAKPASKAAAQPQSIFTRAPSLQYGASSQQSQSTATTNEEDTDSLFELAGKKGKASTSTFDTQSQPSQEPGKQQEREPTATWGMDEGFTAGWLSKGNDTLGEDAARRLLQQQQQRQEDADEFEGEEEDESDRAFVDDDATNDLGAAALMARVVAEAQSDVLEESDVDEMVVDSQDDDELEQEQEQEDEPMQEEEEEEEEEAPPAPAPAFSGGIFAQVGSLASKAAFGLQSLRKAAVLAEKVRLESVCRFLLLTPHRKRSLKRRRMHS